MVAKCSLETDGYRILFELKGVEHSIEYVELVAEFLLNPHFGQVAVKSGPILMAVRDLERLVLYFEQHVAHLQQDANYESQTFVPMELGFQLRALSGEVRLPDEGEFSLLFMVNVGMSEAAESSVYLGGEAVVTLANVKAFISSIQATLVGLSLVFDKIVTN